jgi:hypothetical protein
MNPFLTVRVMCVGFPISHFFEGFDSFIGVWGLKVTIMDITSTFAAGSWSITTLPHLIPPWDVNGSVLLLVTNVYPLIFCHPLGIL